MATPKTVPSLFSRLGTKLKLTVTFPIINPIRVNHPWPIQVGEKTYMLVTNDDFVTAVGVRFSQLPVGLSPELKYTDEGPVRAHLKLNVGSYVLMAEHDLRAWQSLLQAYAPLDIDFDNPKEEYEAESDAERQEIKVHNFSRSKKERIWHAGEFGILARAFLAIDTGRPLIEVMALFRDASKASRAGRAIDAYNGYYLFIETQCCRGRTGTQQATNELLNNREFMTALSKVAEDALRDKDLRHVRFKSLVSWAADPLPLVREIVELRGHLRHHSLGSQHRWDPDRQDQYEREARFLSLVAFQIAFPRTTGKLFEEPLLKQFSELAEARHMTITVHVKLTVREDSVLHDISLNMTFPQPRPDVQLAKAVLAKALEMLEEKSPAAELFAIRAWQKANGAELFRYDVGPTLPR
jgi:hypothetical protein